MTTLLSLLLVVFTISSSLAAAFSGYFKDPAHPGKCVLNGLILSPGEVHYHTKTCAQTLCEADGLGSFYSCGVHRLPDDCKLGDPIHPNALYPDCCEHHTICNTI